MSSDFRIDQKVREEIEEALVEFEKQCGMPPLTKVEAPAYITMNLEDLRRKTPEELAEAQFLLAQYGLYVQRELNRQKAWERWGKAKSDELAAHFIPNIGQGFGYNERELMARNNHELCKTLNAFLRKVRMQIDIMYDVPNHIKFISDSIREIRFSALKREKINGE